MMREHRADRFHALLGERRHQLLHGRAELPVIISLRGMVRRMTAAW